VDQLVDHPAKEQNRKADSYVRTRRVETTLIGHFELRESQPVDSQPDAHGDAGKFRERAKRMSQRPGEQGEEEEREQARRQPRAHGRELLAADESSDAAVHPPSDDDRDDAEDVGLNLGGSWHGGEA
jgi:hypothetical protein